MEIRNFANNNSTNFGMALKLEGSIQNLRKQAIEGARIKDRNLVLNGLQKLIENQKENRHVDIIYTGHTCPMKLVAKTKTAEDIMGKEFYTSSDFQDQLTYTRKDILHRINLIKQTKNPFKKLYLKLQNYLDAKILEKTVLNKPQMALPGEMASADFNATRIRNKANQIETEEAIIANALNKKN